MGHWFETEGHAVVVGVRVSVRVPVPVCELVLLYHCVFARLKLVGQTY